MQRHYRSFLFTIAVVVVFVVLVASYGLRVTRNAYAGTGDTVSGFAWADTIGWISMNCTNVAGECDKSNYGVNIDPDTGVFSGYAWADTVGWISFQESGSFSAQWNKNDNSVTGWAKIISLGSGGLLKFQQAALDLATGKITGWMWNGNTDGTGIGWVALTNVTVAQAVVNVPPQTPTAMAINNTAINGTILDTGKTALAVQEPVTSLYPRFTWSPFTDPNGVTDSQQAYMIVFEQFTNGSWQALYDQTVQNGGNAFLYPSSAPALTYDSLYRWKVRVQDGSGAWSLYSAWTEFRTPSRPLPQLAEIVPAGTANTGEEIQLNGAVIVPPGASVTQWQWNFGDGQTLAGAQTFDAQGNPTGINYVTPTYTYTADGTYVVTLTVTDDAGYVVTKQMTLIVNVSSALPIWQRIIPF